MATEAQINANRANAQKSTGPTSAAGREKSSQNSLRHGLFARAIVIKGEAQDRFEVLFASLLNEFKPVTEFENCLVETMAATRWRQMRMWGIELAMVSGEMANQAAHDTTLKPPSVAVNMFTTRARDLDLLRRFENSYDRQFQRAYTQLIKAKKNREQDDTFTEDFFFDERTQSDLLPEAATAPESQNSQNEPNSAAPETQKSENEANSTATQTQNSENEPNSRAPAEKSENEANSSVPVTPSAKQQNEPNSEFIELQPGHLVRKCDIHPLLLKLFLDQKSENEPNLQSD